MNEEILNSGEFVYDYPIFDETNNEITDPDLELGYLQKESFTKHHEMIPEKWHYEIVEFEFTNGEKYYPTNLSDPHVLTIDDQKGVFKYQNLEGELEKVVCGQKIKPVIDNPTQEAWDETVTYYRYVLYSEKELSDREFLANGPTRLAEAQATIEDLLLVIADLVGGEEVEV